MKKYEVYNFTKFLISFFKYVNSSPPPRWRKLKLFPKKSARWQWCVLISHLVEAVRVEDLTHNLGISLHHLQSYSSKYLIFKIKQRCRASSYGLWDTVRTAGVNKGGSNSENRSGRRLRLQALKFSFLAPKKLLDNEE